MNNSIYEVKPISSPINLDLEVPGSKSITNRALLLASLANGKSTLSGVLFSDDSRHFIGCLKDLGYELNVDENSRIISLNGCNGNIPKKNASVYVGSAGTAARFITASLALSQGEYIINASEQMKARPMKPLFDVLIKLGHEVTYLEKEGFLPCKIKGGTLKGGDVYINSECSSQFISALLMTACFYEDGLKIHIEGKAIRESYINITIAMMAQFGVKVIKENNNIYTVAPGQKYTANAYQIEPDVSSASYFYAMAALTGGTVLVENVFYSSLQGDIKLLEVLKKFGCTVTETYKGILLKGPEQGYDGIEIDMNEFSDQTMTVAALAVFAKSKTVIKNVAHIRLQESNRILAIVTELKKMGIDCIETEDGLIIHPGKPQPSLVETYEDHRMAMAFSLIGLKSKGIKINNPSCTSKTFENYFDIFDSITK